LLTSGTAARLINKTTDVTNITAPLTNTVILGKCDIFDADEVIKSSVNVSKATLTEEMKGILQKSR
jgi:hypothetical protein